MPIVFPCEIRNLDQTQFGQLAYEVMHHAFDVHAELGRLFDEKIYQRELSHRIVGAQIEVPVTVRFESFAKMYYLDLLVAPGAIFELKTVESLSPRHESQLLNYLLLTCTSHGKLINLRPERVEHKFVNTSLTREDRTSFLVDGDWQDTLLSDLRHWLLALLRDWGVGLERTLYEEAVVHHLGPSSWLSNIGICSGGRILGHQEFRLVDSNTALVITAADKEKQPALAAHFHRLVDLSALRAIQWINISWPYVVFETMH